MRGTLASLLAAAFCGATAGLASADDGTRPQTADMALHGDATGAIRADGHAPIGVMGDHIHKAGEWMLSYRFMRMDMAGNRDGTSDLSPEEIVTTVPNTFFGTPGQPATLRIVPTEMTMDMHMFGAMFAPTDWLTLMAMGSYIEKEMEHVTFQGGAGTNRLGEFTTNAEGFGDTKLSGLIGVYDDETHHVHLNAGISLPTGSIDEMDRILAPTGLQPTLVLPYPMQIGSGTFDLLPGGTYSGRAGPVGWGAQYSAEIRLGDNSEGYSLGDLHQATAWGSYLWDDWISTSLRLTGRSQGQIDGRDSRIIGPVQTADPDRQGGERIDLGFGINLAGQEGVLRGQRLALEFRVPVYQSLNGPQMETDWTVTLGWQFAFGPF